MAALGASRILLLLLLLCCTEAGSAIKNFTDHSEDDDRGDHDIPEASGNSSGGCDGEGSGKRNKGASFAKAFAKILEKPVKKDVPDVIFAESKLLQKRKAEEEAERESKRASKKQRLEIKSRGRKAVPVRGTNPAHDAAERTLQRLATRGVVLLFNAVAKAKKAQEAAAQTGSSKPVKLDRKSFLAQLRPSAQLQADDKKQVAGASVTIWGHQSVQAAGGEPGWKVLRDDFTGLIGGGKKMKDWDKPEDEAEQHQSDSHELSEGGASSGDDASDEGW